MKRAEGFIIDPMQNPSGHASLELHHSCIQDTKVASLPSTICTKIPLCIIAPLSIVLAQNRKIHECNLTTFYRTVSFTQPPGQESASAIADSHTL